MSSEAPGAMTTTKRASWPFPPHDREWVFGPALVAPLYGEVTPDRAVTSSQEVGGGAPMLQLRVYEPEPLLYASMVK